MSQPNPTRSEIIQITCIHFWKKGEGDKILLGLSQSFQLNWRNFLLLLMWFCSHNCHSKFSSLFSHFNQTYMFVWLQGRTETSDNLRRRGSGTVVFFRRYVLCILIWLLSLFPGWSIVCLQYAYKGAYILLFKCPGPHGPY